MANVMRPGLAATPGDAALVDKIAGMGWLRWRAHMERVAVRAAVRVARGNRQEAARLLGLHRNTVGRILGGRG